MKIQDYAVVGDGRSTALVSRLGSIDFLCWPRFDSDAIFAALLDPEAGSFRLAPREVACVTRAYLGESNVLVTRFVTERGAEVELTDLMPIAGRAVVPEQELLRVVRCTRGEAEVEIAYQPRPRFGLERPRFAPSRTLGLRARTSAGLLTLYPAPELDESGRGVFRLRAGEARAFSLTLAQEDPAVLCTPDSAPAAVAATARAWSEWAAKTRYEGPHRAQVVRSALLLKLLAFAPSGAIVAAPTTSLPERPGGELNWDYRYCWLRDAALTARALFGLGHPDEAESYMSWLLSATTLSLPKLHVLYDVYGRTPQPERTLPHLRGYRDSRPVRVGNGAMLQVQLDTYGEVIEAASYFVRSGGELDGPTSKMLVGFGEEVARGWDEPDEGIWEVRGSGQDYTHSRVLCWAALHRLLELHERGHLRNPPVERFRRARDRIRAQVETLGYSDQLHSYTRTLAGGDVDASLLLLPWYGYLDASSPRMQGTWRRIQAELSLGDGLYRRYRGGELVEGEGAFGICSFWAAEFLALGGGTLEDAESHFAALLRFANDVGLYAEEIDPRSGDAWGNFPQAYTHVGLINAALSIEERRRRGLGRADRERQLPEARP